MELFDQFGKQQRSVSSRVLDLGENHEKSCAPLELRKRTIRSATQGSRGKTNDQQQLTAQRPERPRHHLHLIERTTIDINRRTP